MHVIESGEHLVALLQRILKIPRIVYTPMCLRVYFEGRLDAYPKVVAGSTKSPEEIWIGVFAHVCDGAVGEHESARHERVVQIAILALQTAKTSSKGDADEACGRTRADGDFEAVVLEEDHELVRQDASSNGAGHVTAKTGIIEFR